MEGADINLDKLERLVLDAENLRSVYPQLVKQGQEADSTNWKRTTAGKEALQAEKDLYNAINNILEASSRLLECTPYVTTLLQKTGQASVKLVKLENNRREKIDKGGGIYETTKMVEFREKNYGKKSSKEEKQIAKANYNEGLSIVVIENWLSLDKLLVANHGDEAADILAPMINIFDTSANNKEQKRLDKNTKERKRQRAAKAKEDENFFLGKSKAWWYKKGLEQMNGMGETQCTNVVADGGISLHIEKKVWRYTDDKTDVKLHDA